MTDTQAPRDAIAEAAAKLSVQADRLMRAAQALTRTALRLATTDQPTKVLQALAKYRQAGLPEPDLAAEVAAMIEGTQSPEWRDARSRRHRANDRYRLERDLSGAELPVECLPTQGLPGWAPEIVLRIAREKCEVLGAAADAIERGQDGRGEIIHALARYMSGQYGIDALRYSLKRAGIEPGQGNVVAFPRGWASLWV
jgi:hypothetical protein